MIRLNTDAAVNSVSQKVGIGFVVSSDTKHHQIAISTVGKYDNHTAEFLAIQLALEWLIEHQLVDQMVFIQTDSQVACDVLQKSFTKNKNYLPYVHRISKLIASFPIVDILWIPEKKNLGADNLAKQALRKA